MALFGCKENSTSHGMSEARCPSHCTEPLLCRKVPRRIRGTRRGTLSVYFSKRSVTQSTLGAGAEKSCAPPFARRQDFAWPLSTHGNQACVNVLHQLRNVPLGRPTALLKLCQSDAEALPKISQTDMQSHNLSVNRPKSAAPKRCLPFPKGAKCMKDLFRLKFRNAKRKEPTCRNQYL